VIGAPKLKSEIVMMPLSTGVPVDDAAAVDAVSAGAGPLDPPQAPSSVLSRIAAAATAAAGVGVWRAPAGERVMLR
jgi:hypothetical protein